MPSQAPPTPDEIPDAIQQLLKIIGVEVLTLDAPLALASLQVIQLIDAVEMAFDVAIPADDITRANFASPRVFAALLARHGVTYD